MNVLNLPTTSYYNSKIEYDKKFKLKRIKDINVYLTYINCENEIEIVSRKKLYIENRQNTITRNQLVDVIKNCQRRSNISYKLISIMVYNINVTPETLTDYIERPEDFVSLFTLSRIDSFELQSTISMLKEFNAMYFFFSEVPQQPQPIPPLALPESREKGEKGEKIKKEIHNQETSAPVSKKEHNTTKRIYINEKTNSRNIKRNNNSHNKTKRYDKYVNLL
jgi:hypothetical protein